MPIAATKRILKKMSHDKVSVINKSQVYLPCFNSMHFVELCLF